MGEPDSQQRGLAGEYYVAFILSCLGYDIIIRMGRAKVFDMVILDPAEKSINVQVKSTYHGYDWLVAHEFNPGTNSVVALIHLGKDATQRPELFFLPGARANELITRKHKNHSSCISRADVQKEFQDHNFSLIEQLLRR